MLSRNTDEHVFIEDVIYCPTQIYYYLTDVDGSFWVAYIRQRRGDLTFELVRIDKETGDWLWEDNKVKLSRKYDINGQSDKESEEREIIAVEEEVLWFLRQRFPEVEFPDSPFRQVEDY